MRNFYLLFALLVIMGLYSTNSSAAIFVSQGYESNSNAHFTIQLDEDGAYEQDDISMKLMASLGAITDMTVLDSIQIEVERLIKLKMRVGRKSFLLRVKRSQINKYIDKYELDNISSRQLIKVLN